MREFGGESPTTFGYGFSSRAHSIINTFGSEYDQERQTMALIVTEQINHTGSPAIYYVTTQNMDYNPIMNADDDRALTHAFEVVCTYEYPQEDKIWTNFGIEGLDTVKVYASKLHIEDASRYNLAGELAYESHIPQIGDVLRIKFNNYLYEVCEVKEESSIWKQSKQYVWELTVKPFVNTRQDVSKLPAGDHLREVVETPDRLDMSDVIERAAAEVLYKPRCERDENLDPFSGWNR